MRAAILSGTIDAMNSQASKQGQTPVVPQQDRAKGDLGFASLPAVDTFVEHADPLYKPITVRRK